MQSGGLSAISIILLVLAANALFFLAAYGLTWWLRKQSEAAIPAIAEHIHQYEGQINQLAEFLSAYAGMDQEPYAAHLDELQAEAANLRGQAETFVLDSHDFEETLHAPASNHLQAIINAPVNSFRSWRTSARLRKESRSIADRLTATQERMQHISQLPWDLALQCRQAEKDVATLTQTVQSLEAVRARGDALQTLVNQLPVLRRALQELPPAFLTADPDNLLASVTVESTVRAFNVYSRIQNVLGPALPRVAEWLAAYQKAVTDYAELKAAGASTRQTIAHPPDTLIVSGLQIRLDQVAQLAAEIGQQLTQPYVEDLRSLVREVSQMRRVIQDVNEQYRRASQQIESFNTALRALTVDIDALTAQFTHLEQHKTLPITWDASSLLLKDLHSRLQALGTPEQARTPEQIPALLQEAQALRAAVLVQQTHYPKIAEQHRVLSTLGESADLRDSAAWLRQAHTTVQQADEYDPKNWSKQDSIASLSAELNALENLHKTQMALDRSAAVRESEIHQRVKDMQSLVEQFQVLRPRLETVQTRLERMRAQEKESTDRLTSAYTALERVGLLLKSNSFLEIIAADEHTRLDEEIRQAGSDLNDREHGEVEKKAQKAQALVERSTRAFNSWSNRLGSALVEQTNAINELFHEVDAIASVNDAPIRAARSLLTREDTLTALRSASAPAQTGGLRGVAAKVAERAPLSRAPMLDDLQATAEIKRKNDLWQELSAAQQALRSSLAMLQTEYQRMLQTRIAALEGMAEITKRSAERKAWPPNNQPAYTEKQILQPVDQKWDFLKNQPHATQDVIPELQRLAQQYSLVNERIRQILGRIEQDEEWVKGLEEQVENTKQTWLGKTQAEPNNALLRAGVQQLVSQADSQLAYIKHQYMRGAVTYQEVIHNLQLLADELFSARVSVDNNTDIGLNETHRPAPPKQQ